MDPITVGSSAVESVTAGGLAQPSIMDILFGGSPVVQAVLILLVVLSVYSWALAFAKFNHLRKAKKETELFKKIFYETRDLSKVDDSARRLTTSPVVGVFVAGYKETIRLLQETREGYTPREGESSALIRAALSRAEIDEVSRLETGTTFLATTASSAPFIGLFGTVWGIMNAFHGLSTAKSSTIQAVAPGISEALIATAVGLAAAIPAAVAFNYIASSVKNYKRIMRSFGDEFEATARRALPD